MQCLPAALSGEFSCNQLRLRERSLRQSSHAPVDWNAHWLTTIRRFADDHFFLRLQSIPQQPAMMITDDHITDTGIAICHGDSLHRQRSILKGEPLRGSMEPKRARDADGGRDVACRQSPCV